MKLAWMQGWTTVKTLEWLTFANFWQKKYGVLMWDNADDLIDDSEIMITQTDEIPYSKMFINQSAVLKGGPKTESQIMTKLITDVIKEDRAQRRANRRNK